MVIVMVVVMVVVRFLSVLSVLLVRGLDADIPTVSSVRKTGGCEG